MPGSPHGQGQTTQPGMSLLRGRKEAKQKETQEDTVKREASLCSPSAGGFLYSKVKISSVGFFLPFLLFKF